MGLIDTSKTERLEHPYEPGQWVEVRPLLATEMDEARMAKMKRTMELWGDSLQEYAGRAADEEPEDTLPARIALYDALTLLKHAVVGWSYDAPVGLEHVERLDTVTRDWLLEEVVLRNTRPLPSRKSSGGSSKLATARES